MSKQIKKESMHDLTAEQLVERVDSLRRDLFSLKLSARTSHVKDVSQFRKLRKDIACALTVLHQKKEAMFAQMLFEMLSGMMQEEANNNEQMAS